VRPVIDACDQLSCPAWGAIYASSVRPEDVLAQTDWSAVEHAYGGEPGVASSPEILAELVAEDVGRHGVVGGRSERVISIWAAA
jgi:hypothetical protein